MSSEQKIMMLPIGRVKPDPNQPRTDWGEHGEHIEELEASYSKHGIIQPLEVDTDNVIILGECRWRAAKRAGLKKVPVRRVKTPSKQDRLERQLIDDAQRKDLNDIERRWAFAAAVASINDSERDYTVPEIKEMWKKNPTNYLNLLSTPAGRGHDGGRDILANRIGVHRTTIDRALSYFDENIPEEAREAADEGLLKSWELSQIRSIKTPEVRKTLTKSITAERKELASSPKPKKRLTVATQDRTDAIRALERVDAPEEVIIAAAKGDPDIVESAPFIARDIQRRKEPIPQEQLEEIHQNVEAAEERKRKFESDEERQEKARLFQSYLSLGQIEGYLETTICPECGESAVNNLSFGCHNHTIEEARESTAKKRGIEKVKGDEEQ